MHLLAFVASAAPPIAVDASNRAPATDENMFRILAFFMAMLPKVGYARRKRFPAIEVERAHLLCLRSPNLPS